MTKAIHILSTAPARARMRQGDDFQYSPRPFEVICTALSALMWRNTNGPVGLFTDSYGYEYYRNIGILDIWDAGINIEVLENMPDINHSIFWAASKLFALREESAPVAMIDTDLIIWKNLDNFFEKDSISVLHREELIECYVNKEDLKVRPGYSFNPEWNWKEKPCNTAFAYFNNQDFKQDYIAHAMDFMTGNNEPAMENVSQMVFAEQRLLAMHAASKGIGIIPLVDDPFQKENDIFTHLWGAKDMAREFPHQAEMLVNSMMNKLRSLSEDTARTLASKFNLTL